MRKIVVDLNLIKDNEFQLMYDLFGLDVEISRMRILKEECFKSKLKRLSK